MIRSRHRPLLCLLLGWTVCAVMPPCLAADGDGGAACSLDELRARLTALNQRVRRYHIIYESVPKDKAADPLQVYIRREAAAAAPRSYFHFSAKGTYFRTPAHDPIQQRLRLHDGAGVIERPFERSFERVTSPPDAPLPGSAPRELLFLVLGWWPLTHVRTPTNGHVPAVIPDIVASPHYRVRPRQELQNGRWCYVLEYPRRDVIWMDAERACAWVVRDFLDETTGRPLQRIEAFDHAEVYPGVWVPMRFRNRNLDAAGGAHRESDAEFVTVKAEVNMPGDELFKFSPPPGALQIADGKSEQVVPEGTELLDAMVAIPEDGNRDRHAGTAMTGEGWVTIAINVTSSLCVLGVVLHRLRTRRPASNGSIPERRPGEAGDIG
jgi:hypothetical protein